MKKIKISSIRRSNKKPRCGICLIPFTKNQLRIKREGKTYLNTRFPLICGGCNLLINENI